MIVGNSEPLYEKKLGSPNSGDRDELSYLHQFILHSSLDMVQSSMVSNNATFLKVVDRFNSSQVSAYLTPGGAKFLLLHGGKGEDAIRHFFVEVHEFYVKHILCPFTSLDAPIRSPYFDSMVGNSARILM